MAEGFDEFAIEWTKSSEKATVTAPSATKLKGQVVRLAEKYPDEADYIENKDGSICGHVPVKWVNIRHPKKLTEEQKQRLADNLRKTKDE